MTQFERRVLIGLVCSSAVLFLVIAFIQSKNAVHLRVTVSEAFHEN